MKNKGKLDLLANKLLEKEVIFKEDLVKIFGERPFPTKENILADNSKKKPAKKTATKTKSTAIKSNKEDSELKDNITKS